jgi:hexosaminidase
MTFIKHFLFLFIFLIAFKNECEAQLPIIPYPASVEMMSGSFNLNKNTSLVLIDDVDQANNIEIKLFNEWIFRNYGFKLMQINTTKVQENVIQIRSKGLAREQYELNIQGSKIQIKASGVGLKNAFETLKQLMHANKKEDQFIIPSCFILDSAQYQWRGMHLDVARHFFDKEFIKKYIDYISMYKMNVFHWHLTDDQGWRIEIKKYPKLTSIGSKRKGSMVGHYTAHQFDSVAYGGYYTQEDIKEIVAYAKLKHVTIVPEIEMPGHALAALAAYPQFACTSGPFEVSKEWGVFDDVFCPKPETFSFIEDVLKEVMMLFPGEYIHIGGDECPKTRWKSCVNCQNLMKKENINDEHHLQSYFIQRIEKFVNEHQKKIIGWDEILEGGLAQNAAVMSWRGTEGGVAAAQQGHYVVMTPGSHCYFDHYQGSAITEPLAIGGFTPIEKVYKYEIITSSLSEQESKFILGAQANIWTEYIKSPKEVEYFALPRMAALSEVLWTSKANKNFIDFLKRLQIHFNYLELNKINYSKAIYNIDVVYKKDTSSNQYNLNLNNLLFTNKVNNSSDSIVFWSENKKATTYKQPILLASSFKGFAQFKRNNLLIGSATPIDFRYHLAVGKNISFTYPPSNYYKEGCLTDGIIAHFPRINTEWLAWSGQDMEAVVAFSEKQNLQSIDIGFLKNDEDWIYLPSKVNIYFSDEVNKFNAMELKPVITNKNGRYNYHYDLKDIETKFVKVIANCAPRIAQDKKGAGENAWLFVDEIEIH